MGVVGCTVKIYLVRHGETLANANHMFQGRFDSPLTEHGLSKAETLAGMLAKDSKAEIEVILSSPLARAVQTAQVFEARLSVPLEIVEGLVEICYGDWESKTKEEVMVAHPEEWKRRNRDKYHFVHPGHFKGVKGQSYAEQFSAVAAVMKRLERSGYDHVLIVTHLGAVRNAKKIFERCTAEEAVAFTPGNDSLITYEL